MFYLSKNKKGFQFSETLCVYGVEDNGFEPMTSCMPCKRSTNWANPPKKEQNPIRQIAEIASVCLLINIIYWGGKYRINLQIKSIIFEQN